MRENKLANTSRNLLLVEYKNQNPTLTDREIGEIFCREDGKPLSRQRVNKIYKDWKERNG